MSKPNPADSTQFKRDLQTVIVSEEESCVKWLARHQSLATFRKEINSSFKDVPDKGVAKIVAYTPVLDRDASGPLDLNTKDQDLLLGTFLPTEQQELLVLVKGETKLCLDNDSDNMHNMVKELEAKFQLAEVERKSAEVERKALEEKFHFAEVERKALEEKFQLAEVERKAEQAKLKEALGRETKRATLAEKALAEANAAQAENLEDVDAFVGSGCHKDTIAYHRIKTRHLVHVTQTYLGFFTGMTTNYDDHKSSRAWRQKFSQPGELSIEDRVQAAETYITKKTPKELVHKPAIDALVASGALHVLVDDNTLRTLGNQAAHPGPVTSENEKEYRTAVASMEELANNQPQDFNDVNVLERKKHLDACIDFLLAVSVIPKTV